MNQKIRIKLKSYDHNLIEVGRHGVQLVHGMHQAVFLPQVAVEQGWDLQQLLDQLSVKAGLPPGFWGPATLFVFESENFGEQPE